ncbi:MAG: low molecular weight phosphotyrosine protein phosphatase, partial [Flavobacterium sp.]
MDNSNYNDVIFLAKTNEHKAKVKLILYHRFPGANVDVHDHYYGLQDAFEMVYEMLDEASDIIAKKLIAKNS